MRGLYRQLNRLRTTISLDSTLTLVPPAACAPLAAGFLTKRGFLQASLVRSLKRIKVADVMKQPVIRVAAETPIKKALEVGGKACASLPGYLCSAWCCSSQEWGPSSLQAQRYVGPRP